MTLTTPHDNVGDIYKDKGVIGSLLRAYIGAAGLTGDDAMASSFGTISDVTTTAGKIQKKGGDKKKKEDDMKKIEEDAAKEEEK